MERATTTTTPMREAARQSDERWKANGALRNVLATERRRRAAELAAADLDETLKQETVDALRQKARDLQNDKWMYEDIKL